MCGRSLHLLRIINPSKSAKGMPGQLWMPQWQIFQSDLQEGQCPIAPHLSGRGCNYAGAGFPWLALVQLLERKPRFNKDPGHKASRNFSLMFPMSNTRIEAFQKAGMLPPLEFDVAGFLQIES
jgi:hypothetical protein